MEEDQLYNLGTRDQPGFRVGCGPGFLSTPVRAAEGQGALSLCHGVLEDSS